MKNNPELIRCCRKKLRKGRSLFSQAVDYISLRVLVFLLCYMWFGANIANNVAKVLLSIITALFISVAMDLINSLRLDALIKKERSRAAELELNRRISLLTEKERSRLIGKHIASHRESFGNDRLVCSVSRPSGVTADDVIKAIRGAKERKASSAALFHSGTLSHEAAVAAYSIDDIPMEFISLRSILDSEDAKALMPTIAETDNIIIAEAETERKRRRAALTSPFVAGRTRGYILCAACLTAMSFFVEYSLYFRLMAAACVLLGVMAWWLNKASA
ncbi:MAG: hypothetical protein PUC76_07995 [Clostridia bacterium]|nr:hypothetical protein [Clostridia bacterium]